MESPEHDDDRLRTMALVLAEAEHRVKTSITIISAWASTLDDRWDALTLEERRTGIHVIRERIRNWFRRRHESFTDDEGGDATLTQEREMKEREHAPDHRHSG